MEEKLSNIEEEHLKFLVIYNYIKNIPQLKELAESLESSQTISNDNSTVTKIKIKSLMTKVENEGKKLLTTLMLDQNLVLEKMMTPRKATTIYMDGTFDLMHSGHFNAIRQSKKLGDILLVGVNSDEEVEKAKGPLIMNINERTELARACKWADVVLVNTPYTPTIQFLDEIGADYCAHGDDMPLNENGEGCYEEIKRAGRLRVFKRTEGISTTEIIGRLLSCCNVRKVSKETSDSPITSTELVKSVGTDDFKLAPIMSNFLSTSWRIAEFCNNRTPKDNDRIVYIDGSFDILHIGHIETLKKARELGDFLYVGVHDDSTINKQRGKNYPILNLQERTFNLLAFKYVDEVVIGAPWTITEDLIKSLKIDLVVQGSVSKFDEEYLTSPLQSLKDPYIVPKKLGIYQDIPSAYDLTNELLVQRIVNKRDVYVKKYQNKSLKEAEYYQNKNVVQEI